MEKMMSLEEEIVRNTAAVEKNTAALMQLLAQTEGVSEKAKPAAEPKAKPAVEPKVEVKAEPKAEPKAAAADTPTTASVLAKLGPWVNDFAKGTPEGDARRAKLAEVLGKLGAAKVSEITDSVKIGKLDTWFDTKMVPAGRLAPDAEASGEEEL